MAARYLRSTDLCRYSMEGQRHVHTGRGCAHDYKHCIVDACPHGDKYLNDHPAPHRDGDCIKHPKQDQHPNTNGHSHFFEHSRSQFNSLCNFIKDFNSDAIEYAIAHINFCCEQYCFCHSFEHNHIHKQPDQYFNTHTFQNLYAEQHIYGGPVHYAITNLNDHTHSYRFRYMDNIAHTAVHSQQHSYTAAFQYTIADSNLHFNLHTQQDLHGHPFKDLHQHSGEHFDHNCIIHIHQD